MLHKQTISPFLEETLKYLMKIEEAEGFSACRRNCIELNAWPSKKY